MDTWEIIGDILKIIVMIIVTIGVTLLAIMWLDTTLETNTLAKENNAMLKELCVQQGINPDSVLIQLNDTTCTTTK